MRKRMMFAISLVLLGALAAPAAAQNGNGLLPALGDLKKIVPPAGQKVAFAAYAEGVQIYRWNGAAWTFVAPEALLYFGLDDDAYVIGTHYVGPTWESNSGSKVVGA